MSNRYAYNPQDRPAFGRAMSGDIMRHEEFNELISMLKNRTEHNRPGVRANADQFVSRMMLNETGVDLPVSSIVGIARPFEDITAGDLQKIYYRGNQVFVAELPVDGAPVAVYTEPCYPGSTAPAMLHGTVLARIFISDFTHISCKAAAGQTDHLVSAEDGNCFITWKPSGPSVDYPANAVHECVVNLNVGAGQGGPGGTTTCKQELYLGIAQGAIPHGGVGQAELYDRPGGTLIGTFQVDYKWFLNDATDINDGDHMSVLDLDPSGDLGLTDTTGKYLIVGADCPTTTP